MRNSDAPGRVLLAGQRSASAVLHGVLTDTDAAFPEALAAAGLPAAPDTFRRTYAELLPRFEAARVASPLRQDIASHAVAALQSQFVWQTESNTRALEEVLCEPAAPLALTCHAFTGQPGWRPGLIYQGERWEGARLAELAERLVTRDVMTTAAGEALRWVAEALLDTDALQLADRRIAVLGGGAEMAPTRFWLEAGADVLWLDTAAPPAHWLASKELAGRLFWPEGGIDLLTQPREALATLIHFAGGRPLDLGLYAYAPGQARELRLTGVMNALVNSLPSELIGSITLLVSPTTPASLSESDLAASRSRREARPAWESALAALGLLGRGGGYVRTGDAAACRTVVSIQGASYQAAQYLGKVLMAERWAAAGQLGTQRASPIRVSANTAAITRTRSMNHPVFAAAFVGAGAFGVQTFSPRLSRRLNGLLALHDWLRPTLPMPGTIRVHGGIHTLPYPLSSALRIAAAIGFARSPRLLRGLLSR